MKNKRPNGYCAYIADIVGTSRHYVSQVLSDPSKNNGEVADLIKKISENIDAQKAEMKSEITLTTQN